MLFSGLLIVLQMFLASSFKPQSSLETAVSYYSFNIHVKYHHWVWDWFLVITGVWDWFLVFRFFLFCLLSFCCLALGAEHHEPSGLFSSDFSVIHHLV